MLVLTLAGCAEKPFESCRGENGAYDLVSADVSPNELRAAFLADAWLIGEEQGYAVSATKLVNESVSMVGRVRATGAVMPNGTQVRGYIVTVTAKLDGPMQDLPDPEALAPGLLQRFRAMPDPPDMPVSPGQLRVPVQCTRG